MLRSLLLVATPYTIQIGGMGYQQKKKKNPVDLHTYAHLTYSNRGDGLSKKESNHLHTYVYLTKQHPVHTDSSKAMEPLAVLDRAA